MSWLNPTKDRGTGGDVTRDNVILTILYDEANAILREIAYEFEK